MFDTGVDSPLDDLLASIRLKVAGIEVDGLEAPAAALLVERCAEAERLLAALRVRAAATLADKALWRREGFRSVAAWMASHTGTGLGRRRIGLGLLPVRPPHAVPAGTYRPGARSGLPQEVPQRQALQVKLQQ